MDLITMYTIAQLIPKHLRPVFFKIRNSELLVVSRTKHKISIVHLLTPLYICTLKSCSTGLFYWETFQGTWGAGVWGAGVWVTWGWGEGYVGMGTGTAGTD